MLRFFLALLTLALSGCETTPVKTANEIQTENTVHKSISLPVDLPIALYVDSYKPDAGVNFYGSMEETSKLVAEEFFSGVEFLKSGERFLYLFKFHSNSDWEPAWGRWITTVKIDVLDNQGKEIYSKVTKDSSGMTTLRDFSAVFNSQAKIIKETLIDFLNKQGADKITSTEISYRSKPTKPQPAKVLLQDLKPASTGTGFYLDLNGNIMTANHVVQDCIYIDVGHKDKLLPAQVLHKSRLLDIAVLSTNKSNSHAVSIRKNSTPTLGKNIFVTGYPLQGLLSTTPSLTIGTVSSLGGLKGANGTFMFSAPVQPGSSGSAIVDYSGNLIGMVTSGLNQKMLLEKLDTSSQNANFGIDNSMLVKFLDKHNITYYPDDTVTDFEKATVNAVEYTNQVLCYK
jgi:S1-C subfamily serine protease